MRSQSRVCGGREEFGKMVSLAWLSGQARVDMAVGVRARQDRIGQDRAKSTAGRMTMKV